MAAAAATAEYFLQSDYESVIHGKEVEEYDATSYIKKRERDIAYWIDRPRKPPSSNKYEEAEGKEEDVGATQDSTEDNYPIGKYEEGRGYYQGNDRKDTVVLDTKNTNEEASLRHEGESSLSDSSERSDNNDDDDDVTGA